MLMSVVPKAMRDDDMQIMKSSPGYEITESDTKYQVAVDVPGIKLSDMNIQIEQHGTQPVLHISGTRKVERMPNKDQEQKESYIAETKFEKRFTIGTNVDIERMTANLSDGVLVLSAPKKEKTEKPTITIPITENLLEEKKD
jgi:HSP20 family protein